MGRMGPMKQFQLTQTLQQNSYTLTADRSKRNYIESGRTLDKKLSPNTTGIVLPTVQKRFGTDMRRDQKPSQINSLSKRSSKLESEQKLAHFGNT